MSNTVQQNFKKQRLQVATPRRHHAGVWRAFMTVLLAAASVTVLSAAEKQVTIPAGTTLLVKLDKAVSSSDKVGTKFSGVLQGDLANSGVAAVKSGSAVYGEVLTSKKARRARGKANVTFALNQVNINGQLVTIATDPIGNEAASSTKKPPRGRRRARPLAPLRTAATVRPRARPLARVLPR